MALEITKTGIKIQGGIDYPDGKKPYLMVSNLDLTPVDKIHVTIKCFLDRVASDVENKCKNRESEVIFKPETLFLKKTYTVLVNSSTTLESIHTDVKGQIEAANEDITVVIIDI